MGRGSAAATHQPVKVSRVWGVLTSGLTVAVADSVVVTGFPGVASTSAQVSRSCSVRSWHAASQQAISVASVALFAGSGWTSTGIPAGVHFRVQGRVSRGDPPHAVSSARAARGIADVVSHAGSSATARVMTNGHSCRNGSRATPLDLNSRVPSPPQ